jgi:hypothetical protein
VAGRLPRAPVVSNLGSVGGYQTSLSPSATRTPVGVADPNAPPTPTSTGPDGQIYFQPNPDHQRLMPLSTRPRPDVTQPMAQPQATQQGGQQDYSHLAQNPEEAAFIQRIVDAQTQGYGGVRPGQVEYYLNLRRDPSQSSAWATGEPGRTMDDYWVERATGMGAGGEDTATQGQYAGQNFGSLEHQQAGGAPFAGGGPGTLGGIASTEGLPWFTPPTGTDDPGFAFAMEQGQKALERSASAKGTLLTGGALKDLAGYSTGMALQGYGDAWNRFDRTRNFHAGLLQNMSGMGLNAAGNFGGNAADILTGQGNAQAAATATRGANWANTLQGIANTGAEAFAVYRNRQPNAPLTREQMNQGRITDRDR